MSLIKREVAVVGGGLAGTCVALGFAEAGFDTILLAPRARADRRSTALIGPSVRFLEKLGVMSQLSDRSQAMMAMRIIDDTGRLLRAPTVEFRASEIDLDAFGYNVMNADLLSELRRTADRVHDRLTILEEAVETIDLKHDHALVRTQTGEHLQVQLLVGADGRNSLVRDSAGISTQAWSYPQSAVVLNFAHDRDHDGISTEFHTRTGPFTQVPLPRRRSSLVWVEEPKVAELLVDLPRERLSRMVEERLHSILGQVEVQEGVQSFPLTGATATRMTGMRTALLAEAAHVFPPIGAQGLNLGLRDASDLIETAKRYRDDPGSAVMLGAYEALRRRDVVSRTAAVDLLNRSLLSEFVPVQALRAMGLSLLAHWPTLRRAAMREGVEPGSSFARFGTADGRRNVRGHRSAH